MDHKQLCVANVQYKKPTADDAKSAKNLLRYLTYRDSRNAGVKLVSGMERWVDHGMGGSVGELTQNCQALASDHVLLFSLVFNPNPQLMAMVAPEEREGFIHELTERTVEDFFETRGIDTGVEFSYVLHHRQTEDQQSPGLHNPHTHVVLPGTLYDEEFRHRVPLYFSRNKKVNHIELLHEVTENNMVDLMERYVGLDWEQRYDALEAVREQQRLVILQPPHGVEVDEEGEKWNVWCGVRQTDEKVSALGYYHSYPQEEGGTQLEFRPLASGLPHDQAAFFAHTFSHAMEGELGNLREMTAWLNGMSRDERAVLVEEIQRQEQRREQSVTPNFER